MALTLTQQFRGDLGKRQLRVYKVTHDETTSSFSAISVDLTHIDSVMRVNQFHASAPADLCTFALYETCSVDATGSTVDMGLPMKAASKSVFYLIGW